LVCSCIILASVRSCEDKVMNVNIPLVVGHSSLRVLQVEVIGEVVLSVHGF
jgi:hypothetical protein